MSLFDDASLVLTPNGYKASKLYSIKPTSGLGDMTVVRATTARRVNSAGLIESVAINVPRLDYTGGGCPSILVEPARTNLLLRSEEFNDASWTKTNATITANVTTAPDGTMTADKLVDDATLNQHRINQTPTAAIGTYTFSVFLKKAEIDTAQMRIGLIGADFNLTTGTTSGAAVGITSTIQNYGNGWYRCSITKTTIIANDVCRINLKDSLNNTYTGNGVDGFYLWGAQLELGSYDTSYIPTVASSVTRNADVISQTGISSLIGQTEGTLYAEVIIKNTESQICASIQRDTGINYIFIAQFLNKRQFSLRANNVTIFNYNVGVFLSGTNKVALVYNTNGNISAFLNGVKVSTLSTSAFAFSNTLDSLQIYDDGYYSSQNTTNNKSTILFKTALTDGQAISLTTL